jgi:hypothetical protein
MNETQNNANNLINIIEKQSVSTHAHKFLSVAMVLGPITRNERSNNTDNMADIAASKQHKQAINIFTSQHQAATVDRRSESARGNLGRNKI